VFDLQGGKTLKLYKRAWIGLVLTAILVTVLVIVAGCGGGDKNTTTTGAASQEPVEGGTLKYYIAAPSFIEPTQAFESEGIQVVQAVFDSLTQFDYKTNALLPAVAESWDKNADASVWTFHLQKGTKFHNGREVTAADFKYAWERICNPVNESGISYHLSAVKGYQEMQDGAATELSGVKAIDNYTLEVTLLYPYGDFDQVVGHPDLCPLPKEEVDKDPAAFALKPIGNGPFMVTDEGWVTDQYIKVVKFQDYKGAKPHVDGIDFLIFKDIETAWLEFKAGNIDFIDIPEGQIEATKAEFGVSPDGYTVNPGAQTLLGPELGIYYLLLNNKTAPFDNADMRRAVSLAINRQAICDVAYEGTRAPADTFIPAGMPGYVANAWPYSHYDLAAAKEMLVKAGYPAGTALPPLALTYNSGAAHDQLMAMVQADLKALGFEVTLDTSDGPTYWDKAQNGNYQIGRSGWSADYPTIDNFIYAAFFSTSGDNYSQYNNPAVDKAILDARKVLDPAERLKAYEAVVAMIGEDCAVIPVNFYKHRTVGSSRLHNFTSSSQNYDDFVSCWLEAPAK
jgi:oligopeptide transport system substrate-binding protein